MRACRCCCQGVWEARAEFYLGYSLAMMLHQALHVHASGSPTPSFKGWMNPAGNWASSGTLSDSNTNVDPVAATSEMKRSTSPFQELDPLQTHWLATPPRGTPRSQRDDVGPAGAVASPRAARKSLFEDALR